MNQESLVADLKAEIASGSIVVVAGTGVSIMASNDQQVDGYSVARWDSLLNHGVDCCFNQNLITASLASLLKQQIASGEIDVLNLGSRDNRGPVARQGTGHLPRLVERHGRTA